MTPGKFDNALDEAIYGISLDGGADEEEGSSTEAPGTWAGLMRDGDGLAERIERDSKEFPNVTKDDLEYLREDGAAGVILTESTQGFVGVHYYAKESDLEKDWEELREDLALDDDEDDGGDFEPNTGSFKTISEIKQANKDAGQHFFEKGAMRFFKSRVEPRVYGGEYFVTSEQFDERSQRKFTVRRAEPDGSIETVGKFQGYSFKEDAVDAIKGWLKEGHRPNGQVADEHRRHTRNTTIADRRKAGIIEGLTKAEMDSMEIRIPTFDWKQVGGDMNPGAHGGIIAAADGQAIEIIEIQPVRDHVGDREAKEVGYPFWSKEGYYDLDDLSLAAEDVQSAIEFTGLGEHLLEMTPEQRALAIAEACIQAGHGSDEGPAGWAEDVVGARVVEWARGTKEDWKYLADEDEEFKREVLGYKYQLELKEGGQVVGGPFETIEEAIESANLFEEPCVVVDTEENEIVWDEEENGEHQPNRPKGRRRGAHRRNAPMPELERSGVLDGLLEMQAESLEPSGGGHVPREVKNALAVTDSLREVVSQYEDALALALDEGVQEFPPLDGASGAVLFADNAPYLVLMTLLGHGVGIWDGDWDEHYDDTKPLERFLKEKLGSFADDTGGGRLVDALDMAIYEAMRETGYTFDDETYVKGNIEAEVRFDKNRGIRKNPQTRWHVFLNNELVETVYFDRDMTADDVQRSLVSHDGYDPRIEVRQPPERRTNLPAGYRKNLAWSRAYINDLPDSAFLFIEAGGSRDASGRTTPRALRHLPYKNDRGKVDLPHLRNALARLSHTKHIPESKKVGIRHEAERLLGRERS